MATGVHGANETVFWIKSIPAMTAGSADAALWREEAIMCDLAVVTWPRAPKVSVRPVYPSNQTPVIGYSHPSFGGYVPRAILDR